jgi:hypothetical protein
MISLPLGRCMGPSEESLLMVPQKPVYADGRCCHGFLSSDESGTAALPKPSGNGGTALF